MLLALAILYLAAILVAIIWHRLAAIALGQCYWQQGATKWKSFLLPLRLERYGSGSCYQIGCCADILALSSSNDLDRVRSDGQIGCCIILIHTYLTYLIG